MNEELKVMKPLKIEKSSGKFKTFTNGIKC